MIKKWILIAALCILVGQASATGSRGLGLGVIIGEPTGITAKIWKNQTIGWAGAAAWSLGDNSYFLVQADQLIHNFNAFDLDGGNASWYYGLGARMGFSAETHLGLRVPLGIDYIFDDYPVNLFIEVVPLMDFTPETNFHVNGAIGVRFFID